jgi:PAS domain S-box-containing protein
MYRRPDQAMAEPLNLLLVEDREEDAELLLNELRCAGLTVKWTRVESRAEYLAAIQRQPDIILADYSLPQFDALSALRLLAEAQLDIPVIVVTGVMSEETCVQSLRHGAADYLLKDRLARLGPAIQHALAEHQLRSARRRAEHTAARNFAMLRAVVDSAPTGVYLKDPEGHYLMINAEAERILGLPHEGCTGKTDYELTSSATAKDLSRRDARCLRRRAIIEQEEVFGHGEEAHTYLSVRYPVVDGDGRVYAVGAIYADITKQKQIESDLRTTRAELQNQASRLEQANAELKELDHTKNEFVASVSHELRTPLASIRGYTEMLADGDVGQLNPAELRIVGIIDRNSQRLLALIDDLLTLFRMDRGAFRLNMRPTRIADVVSCVESTVRPSARAAGVDLDVDVTPDLPSLTADPDQLERVLLNLLGNAIKFSPDGGTVTLVAHAGLNEVIVDVIDHGIGVSEADQLHLFQRFNRGGTAQEHTIPGTGLGLAISKDIVQRHGGQIRLRSKVGKGTTVSFTIPAGAPVEEPEPAEPSLTTRGVM